MKDKFDEDFLEIESKNVTTRDFKRDVKANISSEALEIFKKEGVCEKEFKNFAHCSSSYELNKMEKEFCDKIKNLLVKCLYRSGKDLDVKH